MKKITLLAFVCAMFMAPAVANAQEVTYVEDPAQGYLFNRMQDNWFIQGEGGVGVRMSKWDAKAKFGHRLGAKANLFVGKWFSPLFGFRLGGEFNQMKGLTQGYKGIGARPWPLREYNVKNNLMNQEFNNIGITGDVLFNLTNWICGYKPGRFYNATLYAGAAVHWVYARDIYANTQGKGDWRYGGGGDHKHNRNLTVRAGLLNSFALSKSVDLLLDLRFDMLQEHVDGAGNRTWVEYPGALLGLSYKFNKREWGAPVVPVCPTYKYTDAEGDALVARLADANRKIADLEAQLKKCLDNKPIIDPVKPAADAPLATVYYPINRTEILGVQKDVVEAVSEVMANESSNYQLTGWADNLTGNDKINTRLRKGRVEGVKKALMAKGIAENRLATQISDLNRPGYVVEGKIATAPLGRCVTIERKK